MAERSVSAAASRKVELAAGELEALSVPPCVAVQYLTRMLQGRFCASSIADIAQCEPALAARVLSLGQRCPAAPPGQRHAIHLVLDRLDPDEVRDALLGLKVSAGFEIEFGQNQPASPARNDLIMHSLAVAVCARHIVEACQPALDPHMAYSAGLLHDIGKFALQDIMPKSLAAIVQEAEATGSGLYAVEQKHLGTHHAMLGKQLARKWRLPDPITTAIWLHHSSAVTALEGLPETAIARIVWAADHVARHIGIGRSGSFDPPERLSAVAKTIEADMETLARIADGLAQEVATRAEALGLTMPNAAARYCDAIQAVAAKLSTGQTALAVEGRDLKMASSYLDFAREFLGDIGPSAGAVAIAENLARRWQRFFQTGSICLCLAGGTHTGAIDTIVVEALGHSHRMVLEAPEDRPVVPRLIAERFAVADAQDHIDWLVEQVDVDLELDRTKLVPLLCDGRAVAIVAFELNYPGDAALFAEKFQTAASMAGAVLGLALAKEKQTRFSERLVRAMSDTRPAAEPKSVESPIEALAEMAAGVAHELNNPLSVISGRAQLLAESEADEERKRDLRQIQDNVGEATGVIDDLMAFAEPSKPRPAATAIHQIIEEAIELAGQKSRVDHVNAQGQAVGADGEVYVDSAQVVSALANIIANAIESYTDPSGPIKISVEPGADGVMLQVRDLGCGMGTDTLRKATHPFFSAKPAGRKRGMGLAYAARLLQLNRGTLALASTPHQGTTATVTLPYE